MKEYIWMPYNFCFVFPLRSQGLVWNAFLLWIEWMKLVRDFSQEGIGIQLIDENCQIYLQEREEAYQRELEAARIEKEKEIARLRAQQERAKDKQAEKVLW